MADKEKAEKPEKAEKAKDAGDKPPKGEKAEKAKKPTDKPKDGADAPKAAKEVDKTGPARLQERFKKDILPALGQKLNRKNINSLPRLQKIVVNMGVGKALTEKTRMEQAAEQLGQITGQRPQITKAKKAVSGFRLRENNEIGCRVTLRGKRMYEFLDRLISIAMPRIRDFRGINPKSFDGHGNYSMGLAEQMVFPEIDPDKVTFTQGMDITLVTTTDNDDEARELLRQFGMPFRES
jgi:large subunit ribosomal protein L5